MQSSFKTRLKHKIFLIENKPCRSRNDNKKTRKRFHACLNKLNEDFEMFYTLNKQETIYYLNKKTNYFIDLIQKKRIKNELTNFKLDHL